MSSVIHLNLRIEMLLVSLLRPSVSVYRMNPYITLPFFTFATLEKTWVTLLVKYLYSIYRVNGEGSFLSVTKIAAIILLVSLNC